MSPLRTFLTVVLSPLVLAGCDRDARDWDRAQRDRSTEAVQAYVDRHADSEHVPTARALLAQVQREQQAWSEVSARGTDQALRRYIDQYPDSRFRQQAAHDLELALSRLIANFKPESLLILGGIKLPDGAAPAGAIGPWRGNLRFMLGDGGIFTGRVTFVPSDPAQENVVVAVLDRTGLIPQLKTGRAYIWRGGTLLIDLRDIAQLTSEAAIARQFNIPENSSYAVATPAELVARTP